MRLVSTVRDPVAATSPPAPTRRPDDPAWYVRRFELVLYVVAATSYVGLGVFHKFLLNWVVGPVWLVSWLWAVPSAIDRVRPARTR